MRCRCYRGRNCKKFDIRSKRTVRKIKKCRHHRIRDCIEGGVSGTKRTVRNRDWEVRIVQVDIIRCLASMGPRKLSMKKRCYKERSVITVFILLHEKFLQFDWLRAVVFQPNLKYLHVEIKKKKN